ncbi:MAG TPA: hypothetical protein VFB32_02345, partial [Rudaea sp.]|nr:hypothetical protein [Rudaea sp.]
FPNGTAGVVEYTYINDAGEVAEGMFNIIVEDNHAFLIDAANLDFGGDLKSMVTHITWFIIKPN